jgi:hypothetical protein
MTVVKVQIQKNFTVLFNGVLENPRLSFKAKGLWAFCMSKSEDWQFHVTHLAKVSKEGADAIYSALKELEKEGLVVKSQSNQGGKFGAVDYTIYPYSQEIQKILPLRGFPYTEDPQTENPALPSTDSNQVLKDTKKEDTPSKIPIESTEIANDLWDRILKINPGHKPPNLIQWAKDLEKCHRIDHRSWDDIKSVLRFIFEISDFWWKNVQSPDSLRRQFDKIKIQMTPANTSEAKVKQNLEVARQIKTILANRGEPHLLTIHKSFVAFQSGDSISLDLQCETFEEILLKRFNIRKK